MGDFTNKQLSVALFATTIDDATTILTSYFCI